MRLSRSILVYLAACALLAPAAAGEIPIESNLFTGLSARAIGPAVMSGRISSIDALPGDTLTIYVGTASGGVWKSDDGGLSFEPIFDDHIQSIGTVRIDPADPETLWVGTGEDCTRNSVSVGDGIYKSSDGGDSWEHKGLADSERIAEILVHPEDSATVFVCATGHLWSANEERGVFKSSDGGDSWEKILYVDADTGCSDLAMDAQDPDVLYAGMWQFRRYPDFFNSGGPGSGLYRSTDGGDSWHELTEGLPAGDKGRIAVAPAPSRPSVVYAMVEAEETALYRSRDLGASFEKVDSSFLVQQRPFYFAHLEVDPTDFNRIYKPSFTLGVSSDGGESFNSPFTGGFGGGIHPDHHALWINPEDPHELLLGTDGGVYHSYNRGNAWRFVRSLPVSQYYKVSADMDYPYNVYGGLQDNGSWRAPSRSAGGIGNHQWENLGAGDGFGVYRDPSDPDYVYLESQGGNLLRVRLSTLESRDIKPYPGDGEPAYRFNWNAPIHLSPNEPGTVYFGAQYLLRTRDQGESWERISPDLTTDDPQRQRQLESGGLTIDNSTAENNTTLYAISESPRDGSTIWVGTDDGNLQVTRDGGASWNNVVGNVPGVPAGTWVSSVHASPHDADTAFVTFDGHKGGDKTPYAFRTTDGGASWQSLISEAIEGYAHVVLQDPVKPELLFLGTELGLYISLDSGANWARFEQNLPQVAVRDLVVHPRDSDLVLATHGRGIYILDDLTPLRALTAELLEQNVAMLPSRPAVMVTSGGSQRFDGDDSFVGSSPPEVAVIHYHQKKRHLFGDNQVEIYNADGEMISTFPGAKGPGINRLYWPMRLPAPKVPPAASLSFFANAGPRVPEGTYTIKLIKGKETFTSTVELVADPRSPHSPEDRAVQQRLALELYDMLEELTYLVETAIDVRDQARQRGEGLSERQRRRAGVDELAERLEEYRATVVSTSEAGWLSGEEKLREELAALFGSINFYEGRPTETQLDRSEVMKSRLADAGSRLEAILGGLPEINRALERADAEPITVATREEWKAERDR